MALKRYNSAMATIQIREVPEEAYEVIRRRARAAGQSIQAYMRDQVVAMAARPSKAEAVATIEAILARLGGPGPSVSDIIDDQEFVVAFEGESVAEFLELVEELRGSESSAYTERDVPIFTCVRMPIGAILDQLDGTR